MLGREDLHNHSYEDGSYESMVSDSVYLTMAGFDHAKIVIELVHIQLLPEGPTILTECLVQSVQCCVIQIIRIQTRGFILGQMILFTTVVCLNMPVNPRASPNIIIRHESVDDMFDPTNQLDVTGA
jgi:flavin reductase (DIM6/NTAB) family NADH-FMN oxidoreductase RutF